MSSIVTTKATNLAIQLCDFEKKKCHIHAIVISYIKLSISHFFVVDEK